MTTRRWSLVLKCGTAETQSLLKLCLTVPMLQLCCIYVRS